MLKLPSSVFIVIKTTFSYSCSKSWTISLKLEYVPDHMKSSASYQKNKEVFENRIFYSTFLKRICSFVNSHSKLNYFINDKASNCILYNFLVKLYPALYDTSFCEVVCVQNKTSLTASSTLFRLQWDFRWYCKATFKVRKNLSMKEKKF